ncbi:hypothetical protein CJ195_22505 [Bacillus sp. UMB0899]|nr:hypothetical protein CJ195_22505 [Bacillus sp. UMB0899]
MNGTDRRAILFDKDGTLIEYNTIWPDATRAMIPLFREQFHVREGIQDEQLLSNLGISHKKVNDSTAIASGTSGAIAEVLNQSLETRNSDVLPFVREYFYQYTIGHQAKIKSIGDVKKLFSDLNQAGYVLGIVTADDYDSTVFTMKHLGIEERVEFIGTGDRYAAKPATEAIQEFSSSMNIPIDQIIFIGDSCVDMQFAQHCRKGIAVLSGVGIEKELSQYTDTIYSTIHEIPYRKFFE